MDRYNIKHVLYTLLSDIGFKFFNQDKLQLQENKTLTVRKLFYYFMLYLVQREYSKGSIASVCRIIPGLDGRPTQPCISTYFNKIETPYMADKSNHKTNEDIKKDY